MSINVIVAYCKKNNGIGFKNNIPWNLRSELKYFKEITTRKDYMWIDVPNICNSREEKDLILYDTINRLEQKIKIKNNE